jgi:hypothetical protein
MHGEVRLGAWRTFTALQRLAPTGFVWAATARLFGLPVTGFDRFTRGTGQMRWRLLNAIPVMAAEGEDVTLSAAGRHAGELLVAVPAAALDPTVSWTTVDPDPATAHRHGHEVTLPSPADRIRAVGLLVIHMRSPTAPRLSGALWKCGTR